jgi:energy-coupling factor transporter transmembrane protein EcfT
MEKRFKLLRKVNITDIVVHHFKTLVNDSTKRPDFDDYLIFIIIPVIVAGGLTYFKLFISENSVSIIITSLSIIVGLLFNVIVIIFDIIKRDNSKKIKNKILEQLLSNISYTILISIALIIFTLFTYFDSCLIKKIANLLVYFTLTHYLMTVLMILKRMYTIFMNELKDLEEKK